MLHPLWFAWLSIFRTLLPALARSRHDVAFLIVATRFLSFTDTVNSLPSPGLSVPHSLTDSKAHISRAAIAGDVLHLPGWNIDTVTLGRNVTRARVATRAIDDIECISIAPGQSTLLRGSPPLGQAALILPCLGTPTIRVDGHSLEARTEFLAAGIGGEFSVLIPERSRAYIVSLAPGFAVSATNLPSRGTVELRALREEQASRLRDEVESVLRSGSPSRSPPSLRTGDHLEVVALQAISESLCARSNRRIDGLRAMAVKRACEHMASHPNDHLSLTDLCKAAGASSRTLEYGFREFYDVGPMAFARNLRLCHVRRVLSSSTEPSHSVAASARRWSFSHMGQFGRDYRLLFGESPSATLARACGKAAHISRRV